MAGVAGLEPVTSAVTGQRSNQLSYTPAKGNETIKKVCPDVKFCFGTFNVFFRTIGPMNFSPVSHQERA